ncbi:CesT family type III secretion system chaperone [Labrenzia sp. OB1]|uniref:CesT family type III secretion system chaperone n=1 Tax=Labrenzia sp. OB1 TaxID=1561204 RepID=UPI0007B2D4FC|nr:CesT family type III secretion system chaperone [Labrenzia sp. OB1]KZM47365.1 hypothetical protein OA90_26450 [Labrenzia sp. OB1]
MTGFSNQTFSIITQFAKIMEIDRITPASDGSVTFELEHAGTLCLTASTDGSRVLVSLSRPPESLQTGVLARFLGLSHFDFHLGVSFNAGMNAGGGLMLVADIATSELSPQIIDQCLTRLISLHEGFVAL